MRVRRKDCLHVIRSSKCKRNWWSKSWRSGEKRIENLSEELNLRSNLLKEACSSSMKTTKRSQMFPNPKRLLVISWKIFATIAQKEFIKMIVEINFPQIEWGPNLAIIRNLKMAVWERWKKLKYWVNYRKNIIFCLLKSSVLSHNLHLPQLAN